MFEFLKKLGGESKENSSEKDVRSATMDQVARKDGSVSAAVQSDLNQEIKNSENQETASSASEEQIPLIESVYGVIENFVAQDQESLRRAKEDLNTIKKYIETHGQTPPPLKRAIATSVEKKPEGEVAKVDPTTDRTLLATSVGSAVATTSGSISLAINHIKEALLVTKSAMFRMYKKLPLAAAAASELNSNNKN